MIKDVQISKVHGYEWVADNTFYSVPEQRIYELDAYGDKCYIGAERNGQLRLNNKDNMGCPMSWMKNVVAACVDYAEEEGKRNPPQDDVRLNTLGGFHWVADNYYFSPTRERVYYTTNAGADKTYPIVMAHGMVYVVSENNGRLYPISVGAIMKVLGLSPKPVEKSDEVPSNRGFIIGKLVNGAIRIARNPKTHQDEESCDKEMERLATQYPDIFFVKLAIRDVAVGKMETKVTVTRL